MDTNSQIFKKQPFGNPDGSRAEIREIAEGFVVFSDENIWGGIATRNNDSSARIIVGRKGSGKTVYLRRIQAYALGDSSIYTESFQQSLPTTETILKFCNWFKENVLTECLMLLWSRSILRATISHLLYSPALQDYCEGNKKELINKEFKSLLPKTVTPLNIYSQVSEIINSHHSGNDILRFLNDSRWAQLEWLIGEIISTSKPLFFFVDAVDEEYYHAPMFWLRVQKGLFYQTMRYLRDSNLGNRLHIFICIRDHVLSSIYRSEHQTRYREEPHIKLLRWNGDSARYFLEEKVKKLDQDYFVENGKNNLENWLGIKEINNTSRSVKESICQYLLRHTRLLPRDIIILGNKLCQEIIKAKYFSSNESLEQIIKRCVSESARIFGNEQLAICANHISSNLMPEKAALYNYSEYFTGNKEHEKIVKDKLVDFIKHIGKDRFSYDEVIEAKDFANKIFENDIDIFSILWMNGLVGYLKRNNHSEEFEFFSEDYLDEFNLPLGKDLYVFHSILIDAVDIVAKGLPIVSFKRLI